MYQDESGINDLTSGSQSSLDISYKLLCRHGHDHLFKASTNIDNFINTKMIYDYLEDLKKHHMLLLNNNSSVVSSLFLLYSTANALDKFNGEYLKLSNIQFRSKILLPNLVYILQQHLPDARKFLQTTIKYVYDNMKRNSSKLVNVYVNSFYLDQDIIKHNILIDFLGNGLRSVDPCLVGNTNSFYRTMFQNIFRFYFMRKQESAVYTTFWNIENSLNQLNSSARFNIYRDVLYNIQVDKFYKNSPLFSQLGYNYRIFKNLIIGNELQDVYMSLQNKGQTGFGTTNNEYKLIKIYDDDLIDGKIIYKIRSLPTIFKLLKCVHLVNPRSKPYNEMMIKPELVKVVVLDELTFPFKNVFSDGYLQPILNRIAENFVNSILSGEYINLFTLAPVRIDQFSFIEQIRQFVRLCLNEFKEKGN